MTQYEWTGRAFSSDWGAKDNWNPEAEEGRPGLHDEVVVGETHHKPAPPFGAMVKRLTLVGGGLDGRLGVVMQVDWSGGFLARGLELVPGAIFNVTGSTEKQLDGSVEVHVGFLHDARIRLGSGARIVNHGHLEAHGDCRLEWTGGGANTFLVNTATGALHVGSGVLVLKDVVFRCAGAVKVAGAATLSLEGSTQPHTLDPGARVEGPGRVRLWNGGRLYASEAAHIDPSGTIEVAAGSIVDQKAGELAAPIIGPIQGPQDLVVDGTLLWTGGTIDGVVTVQGVLLGKGPHPRRLGNGEIRVKGGADLEAGPYEVDNGRLHNRGEMRLRAGVRIGAGRTFVFDNLGLVHTAGPGTVDIGDIPMVNQGTLDVREGVLHLHHLGRAFTQPNPDGVIRIAAGADLRTDRPLTLTRGKLRGSGVLHGDLIIDGDDDPTQRGAIQPGDGQLPGRLTIDGSVKLTKNADLEIDLHHATLGGHGQLAVTRSAEVGGTLRVDAPGFAPSAGDVVDVLTMDPSIIVKGRFTQVGLPRPVEGRFLRVVYEGNSVRLAAAMITPGFDISDAPSNEQLEVWRANSPYRWVSYYLKAPCHSGTSWLGRREWLSSRGWGMAVLYVGRQQEGDELCPGGIGPNETVARDRGRRHAQDAATKTELEGFEPGSWIYLDIEGSRGEFDPLMLSYAGAWVEEMLRLGKFNPAIYCAKWDFATLFPAVTAPFAAAGRRDRPRLWVVGQPFDAGLDAPPHTCGIPEATMWQQPPLHRVESYGDPPVQLVIDRDVSVLSDPSAP